MIAYEAWWLPAHVEWRFVGVDSKGAKAWFKTLADATEWSQQ